MTIPREVRKALNLKPSEKVVIVVEGDQAILQPLRGNILDIGGTINIGEREKPVHFRKVRERVRRQIARGAAEVG